MARGAMAFVRGTIRQGTVSDAKNEGERTLVLRSVSSSRERNTAYLRSGPENRTVRMRRFRYYRVSLFRHMPETVAALGRRTARTYMNP